MMAEDDVMRSFENVKIREPDLSGWSGPAIQGLWCAGMAKRFK